MKMPVNVMVYLISKLIEDKKGFTIVSHAMDLKIRFTYLDNMNKWAVQINLGSRGFCGTLSSSYYDYVTVAESCIFDADECSAPYQGLRFLCSSSKCDGLHPTSTKLSVLDRDPELIVRPCEFSN